MRGGAIWFRPGTRRLLGHCKLNATLPVDVGEIKDALLVNWHWEAAMLGVVDTLRARNVSVRMVAYEHFLEDRDRALAGLFDFLGVPPDASEKDIKMAFKKLALKWHPAIQSVRSVYSKIHWLLSRSASPQDPV